LRKKLETQQQRSTQHFTFDAKVKPGRGKDIRAKAAERSKILWEETDKMLKPLTLRFARWLLFDNDRRFIYYASFNTYVDKYLNDAARICCIWNGRVLSGSKDFLMIRLP